MNKQESKRQADQLFWMEFQGGKNFMTPTLVRDREMLTDNIACELTTGTGFGGAPIWGVTLVKRGEGRMYAPDSDCFHSLEEAENHINKYRR